MKDSSPDHRQMSFMAAGLMDQLNPKHPLLQLARTIPWDFFESEFAPLYAPIGRPAKPIRLMVGLSILKHMENVSDEVVVRHWVQNPYYQAFCGEVEFQWSFPCDPSDLVYFRKRVGEKGFEKILASSITIHGEKAIEEEVCIDTTVQEKNVTFPTDAKLYRKIIVYCLKLARKENIKLRRSYAKEIKQRKLECRFAGHPRNRAKARKAVKRLKTIAGRLVRELERKLPLDVLENLAEDFALFYRGLNQKRGDKRKLYSLHEPHVYCMSKGKEHKRYEFGTKVSIATTRDSKSDGYDFRFDFADASQQVCTEVIYRAINGKGEIDFDLTERAGHETLSADDIANYHLEPATNAFDFVLLVEPDPNSSENAAQVFTGTKGEARLRTLMNEASSKK